MTHEHSGEVEKCMACGSAQLAQEIEIFGEFHLVGGYCDNPVCQRYKLLTV